MTQEPQKKQKTYETENLLLLGLVKSTGPSSMCNVSLDPCLNGFNLPSFLDTVEKNVGFFVGPDDVVP